MRKIIFLILLIIISITISSCTNEDSIIKPLDDKEFKKPSLENQKKTTPESEKSPVIVDIIFAGSEWDQCVKGETDGCDIYTAEIEIKSGEVLSLNKLIDEENVGEFFPSYDINKKYLLYERKGEKNKKDIYYYIFETGKNGLLIKNGQSPILSYDSSLLSYWEKNSEGNFKSYVAKISYEDEKIILSETTELPFNDIKEPIIFPDNNLVALYFSNKESAGGQNMIYNLETGDLFEFSDEGDGCTHGSVSPSGEKYFCQSGNTLKFRDLINNEWSEINKIVPDMSIYSDCQKTSVGHPEFCTEDYLITIVSCFEDNVIIKNGLGLYDLNGEMVHWLQGNFEEISDIKNSRTGVCGDDNSKLEYSDSEETLIGLGEEIITYIESGDNLIVLKISAPTYTRYSDGSPIIIMTPTFFTPSSKFNDDLWSLDAGFIQISYMLPGKVAMGVGVESTGVNDYGGFESITAQKDIALFALGQTTNNDGKYISELFDFGVLSENVGFFAFSHPGILATNTLSYYNSELSEIDYFVGRENPTIDKLSTVEVGHWDLKKPLFNDAYKYPASYSSTDLNIDYSNIEYDFSLQKIYFDNNNNNVYDSDDFMLGDRVPNMNGKNYYSVDLITALTSSDSFSDISLWPTDLGTLEETESIWETRETVDYYPSLNSNLKVMLVFSEEDHVHPALDKPHIHQAFDGFFHTANLWTRLNPDESYIFDIIEKATYNEHDANSEPSDWGNMREWSHPPTLKGSEHVSKAAISEMADRVYYDKWDNDLTTILN